MSRYVDAEREAQAHSSWRVPTEHDTLFDVVRLLDHGATSAESDLRQRRFGLILRLILEPLLAAEEKTDIDGHSELAMRYTRALLAVGADRKARRSLASWRGGPQSTDERVLRDLGDTYNRLALARSISTFSVCVSRTTHQDPSPGSTPATHSPWRTFTPVRPKRPPSLLTRRRYFTPISGGMNSATSLSTSVSGSGSSPEPRVESAFHLGRTFRHIGHKTARA